METLPNRKRNRLAAYDYRTPGAYFITLCTKNRNCCLSRIDVGEGLAPPAITLSEIGQVADEQLRLLPERFPHIRIDHYVIMPNHIHVLLTLMAPETTGGASPAPTDAPEWRITPAGEGLAFPAPATVSDVILVFKSLTSRFSRPYYSSPALFQRSFYDHVIRNDEDYRSIWNYIEGNPEKWNEDRFYIP